ncbi:rod shape-determining protein [Spiroplasma citri]|uniref:rod shape-determining protein n=1 Tax=Spiroplasma citri TaxID=2133 RepID=UPI0020A60C18|nr:rod shape-determining protein [Spiroplasma citri]
MAISDVLKNTFNISPKAPRKFIAIDLGTTNSIAYVAGRGIIFNEASVMAYEIGTKKLIALGNDAKKLIGKTHDKIEIYSPLRNGAVTNLTIAEEFIQQIGKKSKGSWFMKKCYCFNCMSQKCYRLRKTSNNQNV